MLTPECKALFSFEPDAAYLDHGGYGVAPREILDVAEKIRAKIEASPRSFFDTDYALIWTEAAATLAGRVGAQAEDIALVHNVTDGVNAVLRSLSFDRDDEILVTSMTYGSVVMAAKHIAQQQGARVVEAQFQYPSPSAEQCLNAIKASITPHTKLALLDHIASPTSLIMPIAEMVKACHERGVAVLVDGAHVPGHIPLDVESIGADWYVGNLHKWFFVPRGCGFLWADKNRQDKLMPTILSWDIDKPFPDSFMWTGTRDPSAFMSIPAAFAFMDRFGEDNIRRHNHALVREGQRILAEAWGVNIDTPDSMTGSMSLIPLPDALAFPATRERRYEIQNALWTSYKIACPCIPFGGRLNLRISAQIYNKAEDYEKLARAINEMRRSFGG